jgi:hypothetical protein
MLESAADLKLDAGNIWWEQSKYEAAYEQWLSNSSGSGVSAGDAKVLARVDSLEKKNAELEKSESWPCASVFCVSCPRQSTPCSLP